MRKFTLTKDHVKLLQNAVVRWEDCEFGAPAIDPKRPYGNSSVIEDICSILGFEVVGTHSGDFSYSNADADYASKVHYELEDALQVVLQTKTFKTGVYVKKNDFSPWKAEKK